MGKSEEPSLEANGLIEDNETVVKHNQQGRYRARGCF
jgi:hypothetical protein